MVYWWFVFFLRAWVVWMMSWASWPRFREMGWVRIDAFCFHLSTYNPFSVGFPGGDCSGRLCKGRVKLPKQDIYTLGWGHQSQLCFLILGPCLSSVPTLLPPTGTNLLRVLQLLPWSIQSPFGSWRREETSKINFHESFPMAGRLQSVALLNKYTKGLLKGRLLNLVGGFLEIPGDVRHHPACPQVPFAFLLV